MKKKRITFINRGKGTLFLELLARDLTSKETLEIKNRKVFKLSPGKHRFNVYFKDRTVALESSLNGTMEVREIPSPLNDSHSAKQISLVVSDRRIKIYCNEQISVTSIIEERGF